MTNTPFLDSAKRCCENANRLLDEAQTLEFETPLATRYYLAIIAQEEAAKAFLLYLVTVEALPWTPFLLRATRDHQCKQLVGIILDYMSPDLEEFLRRIDVSKPENTRAHFPSTVADAMNLLYHEKIRRWESNSWFWAEDPEYDKAALRVADGKRDKDKQRALYVELDRNGLVTTTPKQVTKIQADQEYERGRRCEKCARSLVEGSHFAWDIERIENSFRALFSGTGATVEVQET